MQTSNFWRTARTDCGYTQKEVAEELGWSTPQYISNIERGMCEMPGHAIPKVSKMYGLKKNEVEAHLMAVARKRVKAMVRGLR